MFYTFELRRKLIKAQIQYCRYLSSAAGGSSGLRKKASIRLLIFGLFALGVSLAAIVLYQQFTVAQKPYTISKEEAVRIALIEVDKGPRRDATLLPNEGTLARLLHVNEEGLAFITDEDSLAEMALYTTDLRFKEMYSNKYVWQVSVSTSNDVGESRGYWYLVDANTGEVIGSSNDYDAFDTSR